MSNQYFRQKEPFRLYKSPAEGRKFITTDNPFMPQDKKDTFRKYGFATPGCNLFSITQTAGLIMQDLENKLNHETIYGKDTRKININNAQFGNQFVISPSQELLKSIV